MGERYFGAILQRSTPSRLASELSDLFSVLEVPQLPDGQNTGGAPQGCVLSPLVYGFYTRTRPTTSEDIVVNFDRASSRLGLQLKVSKTKELTVGFRRGATPHSGGQYLRGSDMDHSHQKTQQCLYHLKSIYHFRLPVRILKSFYTFTAESVQLSGSSEPTRHLQRTPQNKRPPGF